MAKFQFSRRALGDLIDIWDYTVEEWSVIQAEKYFNLIQASCQDLANNPQLGKSYDIVLKGILGYKCGEHVIFYQQVSKNEIIIQRILHGMMDFRRKF